jgi:hypothetical protein
MKFLVKKEDKQRVGIVFGQHKNTIQIEFLIK